MVGLALTSITASLRISIGSRELLFGIQGGEVSSRVAFKKRLDMEKEKEEERVTMRKEN